MKKLLFAAALVVLCAASPKITKTVVFRTSMECKNCEKKIIENVSFEKGVRDLSTDLSSRTVTVVFDPAKTDTSALAASLRHLGYEAQVVEFR